MSTESDPTPEPEPGTDPDPTPTTPTPTTPGDTDDLGRPVEDGTDYLGRTV